MKFFDRDKWHEIWVVLTRNPLRTTLTAFGVFWGIFMLILMLGSGKGLENGVTTNFGSMATNSMFVWSQRTSVPYKGLPKGRSFSLKNEDVDILMDRIPEINVVAPRCQLGGYRGTQEIYRNNVTGSFQVMGDVPEFLEIKPVKILEGRFLNQRDVEDKRKIAIIGTRVRQVLFDQGEEAIGDFIRISGVYFKVVGVFGNINESQSNESELESIYVPISAFQQAFNYGDQVGWMSINTKKGQKVSDVEPKVIQVLAEQHMVSPDDKRAFGHWNVEKNFLKMNNLFIGINFLIWLVGTGTLLAGVIGISNIMLVVVKERTKEIGVRKAIGARPWTIISQIVSETVVLTAIAGYIGLVIGVALLEGINYMLEKFNVQSDMFKHPEIDFNVAITATVVIVIAGAIAGLIPAYKASKIDPVLALKSEG
ncbi:MAG: multidrug ABC transporter ATP-binding protein [Crocinitomicaceae bacterium]|nr:multidrug ABC transporter ATP-binding protein [Crocinitomicaceae bacterium]|tara:strand:- start:23836 stop:25107 length:1272 start_codon:yes stop_codon:yes gene_type:complete